MPESKINYQNKQIWVTEQPVMAARLQYQVQVEDGELVAEPVAHPGAVRDWACKDRWFRRRILEHQ